MISGERPNIIVIMADDLGYGDIGIYGNPDVITPNLNQTAENGISFMQHYSASPMCAPARASFLTGKYPHRTGVADVSTSRGLDRIAEDEVLISQRFKDLGYSTGLIGKWHNGRDDDKYHPLNRGFDEFTGFCMGASDYWEWKIEKNGNQISANGKYLTDVFTDEAVNFIKEKKNNPFFLMLTYNTPHTPLQAYEKDIDLFYKSGKFNKAVSTIYAMIKRMDEGIGLIKQAVEDEGLSENTIILFTSDNGPCFRGEGDDCRKRFNMGMSGMKGFSLEGGIKVPAILTAPWIKGNTIIEEIIHFTDWYPTLLALAGADMSKIKGLDGRNNISLLQDGMKHSDRMLFWQWNRISPVRKCNAAARLGEFKLYYKPIPEAVEYIISETEPFNKRLEYPWKKHSLNTMNYKRELSMPERPMLFDLKKSPDEMTDVSEDYPEVYEKLKECMDDWFEKMISEWQTKIQLTLGEAASLYKPDT